MNIFLTPFSDAERSKKHTPKRSVTINSSNNYICTLWASTAIVTKPIKNVSIRSFKETDPSCKRNNPKIFIFCYFSESVAKLNLHNMSLCLNNFFLCVSINYKYKKCTDYTDYRKSNSINLNIRLVSSDNCSNCRNNNVVDSWSKRINNTLNWCYICSFLRVRRKNMNKIFISIIEEIIEKLKCKVKQKNYCALCNIFSIFAEDLTVTYKKMKLIIREPNHCNKNYSARNTHSKQVRPIFTGFITRIINYVSTNTR